MSRYVAVIRYESVERGAPCAVSAISCLPGVYQCKRDGGGGRVTVAFDRGQTTLSDLLGTLRQAGRRIVRVAQRPDPVMEAYARAPHHDS